MSIDQLFSNNGEYLDHIAIAVEDLDRGQKIYELLGFSFSPEREEVPSQGVITAFSKVDSRAKIELLAPLSDQGPIYDFLQKKGPGIHHLCFRVPDVKAKTQELQSQGYQLIYPEPVEGANDCLINFIHPKSSGGVLIELSEKQKR